MGREHPEGEACCGACGAAAELERRGAPAAPDGAPLVFALDEHGVPRGAVVVANIKGRPQTLHPITRDTVVLGRAKSADLVFEMGTLSRKQCEFTCSEAGVRLRDLGSSCGTFVNGQRIASARWLREGDQVLVADLELRLVPSKE